MANEQKQTPQPPASGDGSHLTAFFASAANFVKAISSQIVAATPEGSDRLIIESTADAFSLQMTNLLQYTQTSAATASPVQRRQIEQLLGVQAGNAILDRAVQSSAQVFALVGSSQGGQGGQVTFGFFDWLKGNEQLIKKIILAILGLIFQDGLPPWLSKIIEILEEFFSLLLSLLGGAFGFRTSQIAAAQSASNQNFFLELAALAKWESAMFSRQKTDEEA